MKIKTLLFNFVCEQSIDKEKVDKLRGYFANNFSGYSLIHQHLNNKLLYKSPLIQYKVLSGKPFILGINEGADVLQKIHTDINYLKLGDVEYPIRDRTTVLRTENVRIVSNPISYSFLSPWLALNEKNYEKYKSLGSWRKKEELLRKVLIGNIISVAKGVGYVIPEDIVVSHLKVFPVRNPVKLKGVGMTAFLGEFAVNFELPDYIGLGKSVSRGFGTIKRIE